MNRKKTKGEWAFRKRTAKVDLIEFEHLYPGLKPEDVQDTTKQDKSKLLRSKEYREYLLSAAWKFIRYKRMELDGFKCTRCPEKNMFVLQVHHKTYKRIFHELLTDLVTLCDTCHKREHGSE